MARIALSLVVALAIALIPMTSRAAPAISAYDFIELEISYTTLLARYYKPLTPRRGASISPTAPI
jgi:hypothetical protein